MTLALFVLEPIGANSTLEAVDVLYFCSEECRQIITQNTAHTVVSGLSPDCIEGSVCDECGKPLQH